MSAQIPCVCLAPSLTVHQCRFVLFLKSITGRVSMQVKKIYIYIWLMAVWKKASLHVLNVGFLSAFHRCSCWHPLDLLCACVHKFFPGQTRTQPLVSAIFHLTRFLQLFYQLLEDNRVDKQKPFKYVLWPSSYKRLCCTEQHNKYHIVDMHWYFWQHDEAKSDSTPQHSRDIVRLNLQQTNFWDWF